MEHEEHRNQRHAASATLLHGGSDLSRGLPVGSGAVAGSAVPGRHSAAAGVNIHYTNRRGVDQTSGSSTVSAGARDLVNELNTSFLTSTAEFYLLWEGRCVDRGNGGDDRRPFLSVATLVWKAVMLSF